MEALSIIREHYRDFGPTLAREKLEEVHGLVLGKETIRRLMINAGLWIPRRQRAPKIHQPRYRRPCTGELIQIDGCGKYIDVWHYPDGHKELRLNGVLLPYSTYDRLSEVDPVAIVDNKRLGHVLDVARQVQRKRDNNRSLSLPCSGDEPSRRRHAPSINKSQRSLNEDDLLETMIKLQGSSEAIFGKR